MTGWKKLVVLSASFGAGLAVALAIIIGAWTWYENRPKPWNATAVVATFDHPDTDSEKNLNLFYTIENTTDVDYRMPDNVEIDGKLKRQNSLTRNGDAVTFDKEGGFIPAKQRRRFTVTLHYKVDENFGPEGTNVDGRRTRSKAIAEYMKREFSNLDGFVLFDNTNRYQINLPNGWDNFNLQSTTSNAPPCKTGTATCEPWERDWSKSNIEPGSIVTKDGTVVQGSEKK